MKETEYGTFEGYKRKDGSWEIRLQPTNPSNTLALFNTARKLIAEQFNLKNTTILIQRSKRYNVPCFIAWAE